MTDHTKKRGFFKSNWIPEKPAVHPVWMELSTLSRKRPLHTGHEQDPPPCTKKSLTSLKSRLDKCNTDRATEQTTEYATLRTSWDSLSPEVCVKGESKYLTDTQSFSEQMSFWADTQSSVRKVLEHLTLRDTTNDISLKESVNDKFLKFHHDITEECGTGDKQHSWAVIEKQEEIVMYGPYYPNYNKGEHSEDIIIKQTQEFLESEAVSEDWKVYVFTMNSPCLARNTDPCMLNLFQKAQEWWSMYGVKTHIGYMKCWGFKGTKETLFRDINYSQVNCMHQSEDHASYVKAAEKTDLNPSCEVLFSAVKRFMRSASFASMNLMHMQDWRSYFKNMYSIFESKPEEEKKICTQEVNTLTDGAQVLLSEESRTFEGYLEKGRLFAFNYTFSSQVSDVMQDQMRLTFQQCWKEMIQDKYAEFIREKLTEDFNQHTVELFIKDMLRFTEEYLHIGRIKFSAG